MVKNGQNCNHGFRCEQLTLEIPSTVAYREMESYVLKEYDMILLATCAYECLHLLSCLVCTDQGFDK